MNSQETLTVPQPLIRMNNWIVIGLIAAAWIWDLPLLIAIAAICFGLGAFFGKNPIILIGKQLLNKEKTYILEDKAQLKFNSLLAFIMLAAGLLFYYAGAMPVYFILTGMCAAANLGSAFGYCIGCFIRFQWQQYRYRRSLR